MFNNVSLIIPFFGNQKDRVEIWKWIEQRYKELMPNVEICIGTTDTMVFSKSQAINNAVKKSTKDILVLTDADIIMNINSIKESIGILTNKNVIYPYSNLIRLSKSITNEIISNNLYGLENIKTDSDCISYKIPKNSICVISKELYKEIGGFDERFQGWGSEDIAFYYNLFTVSDKMINLDRYSIYHLYHESSSDYKNSDHAKRNLQLFKDFYDTDTKRIETIKYLKQVNNL